MFRNNEKTHYLDKLYHDENFQIKRIRESCPATLKKMQMSHYECRILSVILQSIKANKVLELGTLVGCSTAWIAGSLSGDNPFVISVEKSLYHYNIAKNNLREFNEKVKLVHSDAMEFLTKCDIEFDVVFIDAQKIAYKQYLKFAKKCLRSGGLLIADNTLMIDYQAMPDISNAMHEFNCTIESDHDFKSAIIPTISGITICVKA